MKMKKWMIFFAGLLWASGCFAQDNNFNLGVQLRSRAEHRNGALFPHSDGDDAAEFINNRSRINMGYQRDKLTLGMSAQHVGVWGQDAQVDKNGRFILNEAWAQLSSSKGFFARFGRQILSYDDERILGALDWNVAGRYHDALKLGYESEQDKLHLVLAFNQNDERTAGTYYASGAQPYKAMQTLWYQHIGSKVFNASFLLMNLGMEAGEAASLKAKTKYIQTLGTNLSYKPGDFQLYGTFYYQTGKTVADKSISAYLWALNASYQFTPAWKLLLASDYVSGNKGGDKYTAFNPLYGTHHKFYGTMDYFYASSFVNGLNPGLWDNQLGLTYKTSPKVNLALNYHYFLTTADVTVGNTKQNKGLGSELDLQVNWNVMPDVSFSAGYSIMLGTDAMKAVKGGNPGLRQDWAWISLNINPKIFVSKW